MMNFRFHFGNNRHTCTAGCGKTITRRFAICADCEKIYGRSALNWPVWLRDSWNATQRERRKERKISNHEVSFSALEKIVNKDDSE